MKSEEKQPIINGGFNFNLSNEEMLVFDVETKKSMCWNLVVSMQFAHSFKDIEPSLFEKNDEDFIPYQEIRECENVDDLLVKARNEHDKRYNKLIAATKYFREKQGRKIYKAQKELGFGGFLEMDIYKLLGYVSEIGSWNDFDIIKVKRGLREIEAKFPRKSYGANNPNTGVKQHIWSTYGNGAYITLKVGYFSGEETKKLFLEFFENVWKVKGRYMQADSIRYELEENEFGGGIEFIMWWD